jgi:hypothetical protein
MSVTDEQINLLNFDTNRSYDIDASKQQALSSSVTTTTQLVPASIPQLTTTINMSQNLIEQSKNALDVN